MQAQTRVRTSQIVLIALTVITALIHFQRGMEDPDIRALFVLNGLGYFALLAAFYLPAFQRFHSLVRWTIPLGPIAKIIEAAMIVILWREP